MRIAIVAPSPVPFVVGGAENLWMGLLAHFNQCENVQAELIKVPIREDNLYQLAKAYLAFLELNLSHFDMILLSLIHICRCRRIERCRYRWSPYQ